MINYYDNLGNAWQVDGDPLTPEEEKELGSVCAISYSSDISGSPIKSKGVYENTTHRKHYVKLVNNRLYDPADDRFVVNHQTPKSMDKYTTSSKKDKEAPKRADAVGEGVTQCRSDKAQVRAYTPIDRNMKLVSQVVFDLYTQFLSTKLKRYYTAATREM